MKHYGDITKIKGSSVEIVDVITGGSPCQDLSVAGKREGLAGARSGLFMEQIRIIKEMRTEDARANNNLGRYARPRFMVWENVTGAFTSNNGEDFRAVLEETAKIKDASAVIPGPASGKWAKAGCIVGAGWSIAWRVHDSQFCGVPQRRKRIALVADFGGYAASEVLFERKSLFGDPTPCAGKGEDTAADTGSSAEKTSESMTIIIEPRTQDGVHRLYKDITPTLNTAQGGQRQPCILQNDYIVRRLTPLECERLQGFPDNWTNISAWTDTKGKKHETSDTARYKALGNSIALPFWFWLLRRISAQYERPATLASLFDGIGGFPLCWETCNGKGSAIWASEIEEFPIAVTKYHFNEQEEGGAAE